MSIKSLCGCFFVCSQSRVNKRSECVREQQMKWNNDTVNILFYRNNLATETRHKYSTIERARKQTVYQADSTNTMAIGFIVRSKQIHRHTKMIVSMEIPFNKKKKSQSHFISASSNCYFLFIPFSPHTIHMWCHPFRTLCVCVCARMRAFMHSFFSGLRDGRPSNELQMCACWCISRCMCDYVRFVMLNIFLFRVVYHNSTLHMTSPEQMTHRHGDKLQYECIAKAYKCRKMSINFHSA